jgi:hypothetical protein
MLTFFLQVKVWMHKKRTPYDTLKKYVTTQSNNKQNHYNHKHTATIEQHESIQAKNNNAPPTRATHGKMESYHFRHLLHHRAGCLSSS